MECKVINRDLLLSKLIARKNNGLVKVITGPRRSGKSFLLFNLYKSYLLSKGIEKEQIIEVDLDRLSNAVLRNPFKLLDYIKSHILEKDLNYYIFIDEIQLCLSVPHPENREIKITFYDVLNELVDNTALDIYVTGSNSKMLSSDVLTEFRGRGDEVKVYPLSFREFYSYRGGDKKEALDEYLLYGGFPLVLSRETPESKSAYLDSLYKETYLKDILARNRIDRPDIFIALLKSLCSSIGSLTNVEKIANSINSTERNKQDTNVSPKTIDKYIHVLLDSFLFNEAKRYDCKGR